jgi:hypothetical protein
LRVTAHAGRHALLNDTLEQRYGGAVSKAARRTPVIVVATVLGLVVVAAAALQGRAEFTGPRWSPEFSIRSSPDHALIERMQRPTGLASPVAQPAAVDVDMTLLWIIGLLVVLVGAALLWRYLVRRARAPEPVPANAVLTASEAAPAFDDDEQAAPPVVRRGLAAALEVLETERVPADAIVRAWLGLEQAADDSGVHRRTAETPTEFTARIIGRVGVDPADVNTLVTLYQDVRFGGHAGDAGDVRAATNALQRLREAWR